MNEIIEYILGKENLLLAIFTIVFTVVYSFSVIHLLGKIKTRRLERKRYLLILLLRVYQIILLQIQLIY